MMHLLPNHGMMSARLAVSWKLTLVLLSVVPAVAIGAVFYGRKVKKLRKDFQDRLADVCKDVFLFFFVLFGRDANCTKPTHVG